MGNSNNYCNVANKKIEMTKEKLYNPDKCSSFEMQFGFEQPLRFILGKRKKTINENKTNINRLLQSN